MILGALVELGVSLDELKQALAGLTVESFDIITERSTSMHISGLRLKVNIKGQPEAGEPAEPHDHHTHEHSREHTHEHSHTHEHHALSDIEKLIHAAQLSAKVKDMALRVFRSLGLAEAKIHGVPVEHIHFHEVGASDSIVDIVGSCWALNRLGVETVSVSPIPLGHGVIRCAHGVYPNPAPATLELISGMPVVSVDEPFELVTPTGAALLASWKNVNSIPSSALLSCVAYSIGRRSLHHRPNVLRASLYDVVESGGENDTCLVLECNLDDTTPELIGVLMDDVLAAGALDVTCTPVVMKKQRPGIVFSVLCETPQRENLLNIVFRGSTTFGIREYEVSRTKLSRRFETIGTPYGDVKVKIGTWKGEDVTRSPEMSDCQRIAREKNVPLRVVYEAAARHISRPN
jgi:uncharacterized protein (TIGR00299 family) protein